MGTPSQELQTALFLALGANADVSAIVADRIYDHRPDFDNFPCLTFGPTDTLFQDMDCIASRTETIQIDCWVREGGKLVGAKVLADTVRTALHLRELALTTHALALLEIEGIRVFLDPDGKTAHGVVTLTALVEER
jgi:hypothetical protein